jgi:hypothetical protein
VERRSDATERSGRCGIEGKRVEVGFRQVETQLARRSLAWIGCHERTHGELREGDSRDERFRWEGPGISDPLEQNHRAGVEDASV